MFLISGDVQRPLDRCYAQSYQTLQPKNPRIKIQVALVCRASYSKETSQFWSNVDGHMSEKIIITHTITTHKKMHKVSKNDITETWTWHL